MIKEKIRKFIIVSSAILCTVIFLALIVPYSINVLTNHRLHYWWGECMGIFAFGTGNHMSLGYTANNKYALHLVDYSWQGNCIDIETTTRFSYKPTAVLTLNDESLKACVGPLEKNFDVVCSKDSHYIAMIRNGWFIDFYDFNTKSRDSLDIVLVGEINEKDMNKWKIYHNKIAALVGQDTVSILEDFNESQENER